MPLVSYIRNSLRFGIMLPLVSVVKILKKRIGIMGKIWKKERVKLLRDLTEKSVNLSTLATFNVRLLLVFGEQDQKTKLVQLVRKKFMITEKKTWENDKFCLTKQSPFLSPNFI